MPLDLHWNKRKVHSKSFVCSVTHTLPLFWQLSSLTQHCFFFFWLFKIPFLCSLALIFSFGSCKTIPPFKLRGFFFFFVWEVPHAPSSQPHQRARAWEAPCKVQKTTVKDNNWVSHKKEGREGGGGATRHSNEWVKTSPSNSAGASFVTKSTLQLMLLYCFLQWLH